MNRRLFYLLPLLSVLFALFGCSREDEKPAVRKAAEPVKMATRGIFRVESAAAEKPRFVPIDVKGLNAKEVKAEFKKFAHPERTYLWTPGEQSWLAVERATTNAIPLEAAMEAVGVDGDCELAFPEIFASYVGPLSDVLPAFEAKLSGEAVPEWFVTREIPPIEWLDFSDVDEDIVASLRQEIRSMQFVRRMILEGNMLSRQAIDKPSEEAAVEKWANAYLRNPHDSLLLERLDNLEKNARGFLEVNAIVPAMKCYETLVLINPQDAASVYNFGLCLKQIGRLDIAKEVLDHAEELMKGKKE